MKIRRDKIIHAGDRDIDARAEIFSCAEDVVEDCQRQQVHIAEYKLDPSDFRKSWEGVQSYAEALELLKTGYQATVEKLRGAIKATPKYGFEPRFVFNNEIAGFAPVVPLALKCVPNCMINVSIKPIKTKVLDVYYDMTARCGTEPEEFIKAGESLLSTIIELEKSGYRFNLYALQSYYGTDYGATKKKVVDFLCIKIKSSDRLVDLKRMSFPLTHPAFFRVIGFDWQSKSPITRDLGCGRGRALGYAYEKEDLNHIAKTMFGDDACYISCASFIESEYDKEKLKEVFFNENKK